MESYGYYRLNSWRVYLDLTILLASITSLAVILAFCSNDGYRLLFIFPISSYIVYRLVFRKFFYNGKAIFPMFFYGVIFLRYTIFPILVVISGLYGGRSPSSPSTESYFNATALMIYELVLASGVVYILFGRLERFSYREKFKLLLTSYKRYDAIICFIGLGILTMIIAPEVLSFFSFVLPKLRGAEHLMSMPFTQSLALYITFTAKNALYCLLIFWLSGKYISSHAAGYRHVAFIVLALNICIYYGLNRMDLIMPATASIILFIWAFDDKKYAKYAIIVTLVVILFALITATRDYASFSALFFNQTNILVDITDMFQGYLGGVYNVAISIETYGSYSQARSLSGLLFDSFRPFIGLNVFLKDVDQVFTNYYFNQRMLHGLSSQIMPMIGQGYIHLGYIFAPTLTCLAILLSYFLEIWLQHTKNVILGFMILVTILRMSFLMGMNTSNVMNEVSMNLVLISLLAIINRHFVFNKQR